MTFTTESLDAALELLKDSNDSSDDQLTILAPSKEVLSGSKLLQPFIANMGLHGVIDPHAILIGFVAGMMVAKKIDQIERSTAELEKLIK